MATLSELADQVKAMGTEMARRVDDCVKDGDMTQGGSECMGGILEWLSSFEHALRYCNLRPSPKDQEETAKSNALNPDQIEALEKLFEWEIKSAFEPELRPVSLRPKFMVKELMERGLVRELRDGKRLAGYALTILGHKTYCDWASLTNPDPELD